MNWSPRVKPIKIRQLYRYARLGIYDDTLLHDVGWELYARCSDIATVADVFRQGRVPCPKCSTKITRRIDPLFSKAKVEPTKTGFVVRIAPNASSGATAVRHSETPRDVLTAAPFCRKRSYCDVLVGKHGPRKHTSNQ